MILSVLSVLDPPPRVGKRSYRDKACLSLAVSLIGFLHQNHMRALTRDADSCPFHPESLSTPKLRPGERKRGGGEHRHRTFWQAQILKMSGTLLAEVSILYLPYFLKSTMTLIQTLGFSFQIQSPQSMNSQHPSFPHIFLL